MTPLEYITGNPDKYKNVTVDLVPVTDEEGPGLDVSVLLNGKIATKFESAPVVLAILEAFFASVDDNTSLLAGLVCDSLAHSWMCEHTRRIAETN